jgi:hypothetical protein
MMRQVVDFSAEPHHKVRTFFASAFGAIAVWLVMLSLFVVWLNRTVTDTPTFVSTLAPIVGQHPVETFVAQKATDQLLQNVPLEDLAADLLAPGQVKGKTDEQLSAMLQPVVYDNLLELVRSPGFAALWKQTVRSAQQQLVSQLNANSPQLTLNLNPAVVGVVRELGQTKLGPISTQISVSPDTGVLNLKGGSIDKIHRAYHIFKTGTFGIVLLAFAAIGLSVSISVHHGKTMRRILVSAGASGLALAVALELTSLIKVPAADPAQQAAAFAITRTLFHNLQLAALALGIVCLFAALGSKLYPRLTRR